MLIDTHCHLNMLVKETFDVPLEEHHYSLVEQEMRKAQQEDVQAIINVGTSLVESKNCVAMARKFMNMFAAVGIHPNDCTPEWHNDMNDIAELVEDKKNNRIVAIGECGFDKHYPHYNIERQRAAFKAHIECALEHDLALIVHTRDARDETLSTLEEYRDYPLRGVIHCFSEDVECAETVIDMGFKIGIGGPVTYPKNNILREVVLSVPLSSIILETDTPFLPPQHMRGKKNHPLHISTIAHYIADLRGDTFEDVEGITYRSCEELFRLSSYSTPR